MTNQAKRFYVETLGCPKNQVDSDKLIGTLLADGMLATDSAEDADLVVVNTCAFIDEARRESIDTILSLDEQRKKSSRLVVTGCMAERYGQELADELPEIADLPATDEQISDAVKRYERLLDVAPLEIEKEFNSLTALMRAARDVDAADPESVQALVELTYSSEKDALASSAWVLATCGVDLSLGIAPSAP